MSRFYASIPTSARKTVPTARGHSTTGITVNAASWAGAIETRMWVDAKGVDRFEVRMVPHYGKGDDVYLVGGIVGNSDIGLGHDVAQ